MYIKPNFNKKNVLISYRLISSGKDPYTGENKLHSLTWKVPKDLSMKEIKRELKKVELDFEKQIEQKSNGTQVEQNKIKFKDFAKEWLDDILKLGNNSYTYYARAKGDLEVILPYFGDCLIQSINPMQINKFYKYLADRTYIKQTATVKKSIFELENNKKLVKTQVANELGIARLTLRLATTIGQNINIKTARTICKYFNVPMEKYFDINTIECSYSKATNASIRTTLVMILAKAKRFRIVEHNFATVEYNKPIGGTFNEKSIYDKAEIQDYVKTACQLDNIKYKALLLLPILQGLRRCEIAGLKWNNINLEDKKIEIVEDVIYTPYSGVKVRGTKTIASNRTIPIDPTMLEVLKQYKIWYDEQKVIHGDLWAKNNHLFLQDDGKIINPCSISHLIIKFEAMNGFRHVPIHSLRHTYISSLISAGVPLKVVSQLVGHSSEKITLEIYTHTLKNQDIDACKLYNDFLWSK